MSLVSGLCVLTIGRNGFVEDPSTVVIQPIGSHFVGPFIDEFHTCLHAALYRSQTTFLVAAGSLMCGGLIVVAGLVMGPFLAMVLYFFCFLMDDFFERVGGVTQTQCLEHQQRNPNFGGVSHENFPIDGCEKKLTRGFMQS